MSNEEMSEEKLSEVRQFVDELLGGKSLNESGEANLTRMEMLRHPVGKRVDVVIDTDAFNEIDDQFAIAYALKSEEKLEVKAICAAPFDNYKVNGPAEGMEKSFEEIIRLLSLMGKSEIAPQVYRGSEEYLPDESTPVESEAAARIVELANQYTSEEPLYLVALGAITNVASALLIDSGIIDKMVVIWLGGHALNWPHNKEFNLYQDIAAARVVFGSGVPLVHIPCNGVVSSFRISRPELEYYLRGKNELCDYLVDITIQESDIRYTTPIWSKVIWDVTAVAWLLDDHFLEDSYIHSPIPEYDHRYAFDINRHFIRYVYNVNRDKLFNDLITKLIK